MPSHTATRLAFSVLVMPLTMHAYGAAPDGQRIFKNNCAMCHSVSPDMAALAGPPLFNLIGRKIGGAAGFA
jgi:cytochrome c2